MILSGEWFCATLLFYWRDIEVGHNEAVLKTVCPQGRVGSNPTLSAIIMDCSDKENNYMVIAILLNSVKGI